MRNTTLQDRVWIWGFWLFDHYKHSPETVMRGIRKCVRLLAPHHHAQPRMHAHSTISRIVWIFWAQGWDEAPPLIRVCRDSWVRMNPAWEVRVLSKGNMAEYFELDKALYGKDVDHVAYADFCRVGLLHRYGGVWVDATTFCMKPLDSWLPAVTGSGFFAFSKYSTTIASWFLVAEGGNYLVTAWKEYTRRYWSLVDKRGPYCWVHYLFEYLILLDLKARMTWLRTPRMDVMPTYELQRVLRAGGSAEVCRGILTATDAPVFKLNWKDPVSEPCLAELRRYAGRTLA